MEQNPDEGIDDDLHEGRRQVVSQILVDDLHQLGEHLIDGLQQQVNPGSTDCVLVDL